ncbi:hypothetical protein BGZ99_009036 [Dissophora globulifera]|uniref:Velvet domain-containing protein n=1 Tax=Dissophora globulifera TaxID=979702 RepID=A0A9P6R9W8_9FUNG|nr:hypothetical protein BGZ99_009036 [Dissophora globulifera]
MHASLVEKDTPQDVLLIKDTRSKEDVNTIFKDNRTKATTGSSVSSLYPLKDFEDNGTESGFFVFPDLSVRMEGTYRLKFSLYEMVGKDVHFCAFVISEPLVVYSAKKFPGMEESTLLSQYFAEQGLKIRIRKEVRPKKRSRGEYLNAPASQSPTDSQHRDPAESQDEDEQASSTDMPLASKRRASGTRNIETRRDEPNVATLKDAMQASEAERRPSQSTRAGEGRSQAHDYSDYQAMPFTVDRPRSAPESHPKQQTYLEEGSLSFRHYSAANKAAEGVSHMDLSPGRSVGGSVRSEPRLDDYRIRAQDQSLASHERHISSPLPSRSGPTTSHRGTTRPVVGHESPMHDSNSLTSPTSPFARSTDIQPESALLKTKFASGQDFSGSYETGALAGPSHVRHGSGPSADYREDSRRGARVICFSGAALYGGA